MQQASARGAGVLTLAAARLAGRGNPGPAVLLVLVALGCLVLAGEEISWGQRVFGVVTPAELAGVNHQAELNVHNANVGIPSESLFKLFAFAMGLAGVGPALLARRPRGPLNRTSWWLIAPPLLTVPGFAAMALYQPFIFVLPLGPAVRVNPLPLTAIGTGVLLLTGVFAIMTAGSGVLPGRL